MELNVPVDGRVIRFEKEAEGRACDVEVVVCRNRCYKSCEGKRCEFHGV